MTHTLHLDPNFSPYKGIEIKHSLFTFAGGEPHIKITTSISEDAHVLVSHRLTSFQKLGELLLAIDALKRMGVKKISVFIPYFPAARQDRLMVLGEPLSVKVYADIINAVKCEKVFIFDPHSEVTPALIANAEVIYNYEFTNWALSKITGETFLISPDGGALKKIYKVSEACGGIEVIECSKARDVKSGKLSGFKVNAEDLKQLPCLIVDDICDGGGTFLGLAEELKRKNAGDLYLAISHGIFSKGFTELGKHFKKIFTTNSFYSFDKNELVLTYEIGI